MRPKNYYPAYQSQQLALSLRVIPKIVVAVLDVPSPLEPQWLVSMEAQDDPVAAYDGTVRANVRSSAAYRHNTGFPDFSNATNTFAGSPLFVFRTRSSMACAGRNHDTGS